MPPVLKLRAQVRSNIQDFIRGSHAVMARDHARVVEEHVHVLLAGSVKIVSSLVGQFYSPGNSLHCTDSGPGFGRSNFFGLVIHGQGARGAISGSVLAYGLYKLPITTIQKEEGGC